MTQKILTWTFYTLFFATPLFWYPKTYELFEFNKMMLVYALTVVIAAFWLLKMIRAKKLFIRKTPLDVPLLLFLLTNIISTILSIDLHTSIWGYYTRLNGGLLSTICYITLYYALVSNFRSENVPKFFKAALFGGFISALWAIPEHFGASPSCALLINQLTDSCWVQDVKSRVFSTLGQPNWLAAYLVMLIYPAIYFILNTKNRLTSLFYISLASALYLAFTFTYSRAATLGWIAGLGIFLLFYFFSLQHKKIKFSLPIKWRWIGSIILLFVFFNLIFGSSISRFKVNFSPEKPTTPSTNTTTAPSGGSQLESDGNESGQIRLVVWKGGLEVFKHYPIFGSGVETFAYSYYNFRPLEHNKLSEWDFLYNKAHNEFLNYLATTGIVGFSSYMFLIGAFIIWSIKYILKTSFKDKESHQKLLVLVVLASYISYLVQNFFGFSVVIVALFFFIFPALAFLATEDVSLTENKEKSSKFFSSLGNLIYRRKFYTKLAQVTVMAFAFLILSNLASYYQADLNYAQGVQANEMGNPGRAYNFLVDAVNLNSNEPLYQSELAYAASSAFVALQSQDATMAAKLQTQAVEETEKVLKENPKNLSLMRTAIRTYYMLSTVDQNFMETTLQALKQAEILAPTDPKLPYNEGVILSQANRNEEALQAIEKTLKLKPNYRDANYTLGTIYFKMNQKDKAVEQMQIVLEIHPDDPQATENLKEWQ